MGQSNEAGHKPAQQKETAQEGTQEKSTTGEVMPLSLEQFNEQKAMVEKWQREADEATGAERQLTEQLQTEFGCRSLKQAEDLLKKLERGEADARRKADQLLKRFEQRWASKLGESK